MQRNFNNFLSSTDKTFNEICYDFISCTNTDLLNFNINTSAKILFKQTIQKNIIFAQILAKHYYDRQHNN